MKWSPDAFWKATPREFFAALERYEEINKARR